MSALEFEATEPPCYFMEGTMYCSERKGTDCISGLNDFGHVQLWIYAFEVETELGWEPEMKSLSSEITDQSQILIQSKQLPFSD
jgi:hypothetical protein